MIKKLRTILWIAVVGSLVITWLPYFDILNSAKFVAKMPQPLAVIIFCNVILTLSNAVIYWLYFKPFQKSIDLSDEFDQELDHE